MSSGRPDPAGFYQLLADGPQPVGGIARELPVTRSAVSQHLKVLKEAGLVMDRQIGTRRLYKLDPARVGALRTYFDGFWNRALMGASTTMVDWTDVSAVCVFIHPPRVLLRCVLERIDGSECRWGRVLAYGSSSSTATSTATVRAGSRLRDAVGAPDGWGLGLRCFAARLAA